MTRCGCRPKKWVANCPWKIWPMLYSSQSVASLHSFCLRLSIISNPLRSFIQSCTLHIDPLRSLLLRFKIFSGCSIHILYYAGVSIMPLWGQNPARAINPIKISKLMSMFIVSFKTWDCNKWILETVGFPLWYRKTSVMPMRKYWIVLRREKLI